MTKKLFPVRSLWPLIGITVALGVSGCVKDRRPVLYQLNRSGKIEQKSLDRVLWENVISEGKDILSSSILVSDFASYHLVQVRSEEKPHRHDFHDLMVIVESGSGIMYAGNESTSVSEGAMIFIPHGTVHYFINSGPVPAVAVNVFSPPFSDDDTVPVKDPEKSVIP